MIRDFAPEPSSILRNVPRPSHVIYSMTLVFRSLSWPVAPHNPFVRRRFSLNFLQPAHNNDQLMNVTFLGTSSGGGPSESRNCSSLVLDCLLRDGKLWMVDCAEGTTRQFAFQPQGSPWLKAASVSKMFVTHMHADHTMGIVPLLRNILFAPSIDPTAVVSISPQPRIEIYGPAGIRTFVRSIMKMTLTRTAHRYVVHELLTQQDALTSCDSEVMHSSEVAGRDIVCTGDGFWKGFTEDAGHSHDVVVDAGPISHRDPCLGYVFRETNGSARKIVVLGDTYDASSIVPLCIHPSPSLVVHEATDAHIPRELGPQHRRTPETVLRAALARGHSIPTMAGEFAKKVSAERLVLNHIGSRFPAPRYERDQRRRVMHEIERQATEAWGSGHQAIAAWDFMRVAIPAVQESKHT
ncbi:unnamed protein product [Mycena citricolor]|uniref:Metallo-beta-lactamase domain-containing protein n=1 Tax=Mycena citricolor TaxID=2018698 RepID=A0AAD2Q5U9_9AGAR|nr:unnamed protein product [Mycena citricolor]